MFCLALIATMILALASAWSTQFPQFFHAFPPLQPPFRPFFHQDPPSIQSRYFTHEQQFRQPLQFYQPPPATRLPALQTPPRQATPTDVHHHHHHVFLYYYLPVDDETYRAGRSGGKVAREPCNDHPVAVDGYPPVYLPPPTPPAPTTTPPSPTQSPCNDDTVVVDNVNYYPFGRTPIVVSAVTDLRVVNKSYGLPDLRRDHAQRNSGPENKSSNFVLANYLLPPDK